MSTFDLFISYNSKDYEVVNQLVSALASDGVKTWFDQEKLLPTHKLIKSIEDALQAAPAIAITFGPHGLGDWQQAEIELGVEYSIRRSIGLIPILLSGGNPSIVPPLLSSRFIVCDLRGGITSQPEYGRLLAGIKGQQYVDLPGDDTANDPQHRSVQLDALAMAFIKSELYAVSESTAVESLALAASSWENDPTETARIVCLLTDLRWRRGYLSVFNKLLRVRRTERCLREYGLIACVEESAELVGILSADLEAEQLIIRIGGQAAARVTQATGEDVQKIVDAVDAYGRLGRSLTDKRSLIERLGDVPISTIEGDDAEFCRYLYKNRQVLAILAARFGMPGQDVFLPDVARIPAIQTENVAVEMEQQVNVQETILMATRHVAPREIDETATDEAWLRQMRASPEALEAIRTIFGNKIDTAPLEAVREIRQIMEKIHTTGRAV